MTRRSDEAAGWLIVLADKEGLRWVLDHSRMAFSERIGLRARKMKVGEPLILYTARGAFGNPTRDQSQLQGLATIASPVHRRRMPLVIGDRSFPWECDLDLKVAFPERKGVPVNPLVSRLAIFPRKDAWAYYLKAGLLAVDSHDVRILSSAIRKHQSRLERFEGSG